MRELGRFLSGLVLVFLAVNPPVLAYAWLYLHVWNLLAGVLYFGLVIGSCLAFSAVYNWLWKRQPEALFGWR